MCKMKQRLPLPLQVCQILFVNQCLVADSFLLEKLMGNDSESVLFALFSSFMTKVSNCINSFANVLLHLFKLGPCVSSHACLGMKKAAQLTCQLQDARDNKHICHSKNHLTKEYQLYLHGVLTGKLSFGNVNTPTQILWHKQLMNQKFQRFNKESYNFQYKDLLICVTSLLFA